MTKFKKALKIIVIVLVVLCLLFTFLVAPRMFGKPDMSAFMGTSIAHRGYFDNEAGIPENSLPSFQAAIDKGEEILKSIVDNSILEIKDTQEEQKQD